MFLVFDIRIREYTANNLLIIYYTPIDSVGDGWGGGGGKHYQQYYSHNKYGR